MMSDRPHSPDDLPTDAPDDESARREQAMRDELDVLKAEAAAIAAKEVGDPVSVQLGVGDNAIAMLVSRQEAIAYGLVTPTPDEVAQINADRAARWHRDRALWATYETFAAALAALDVPAVVRQLLTEHAAVEAESLGEVACHGCPDESEHTEGGGVDWPCPTVWTIADHYGLTPPAIIPRRPADEPLVMPPEGNKPLRLPRSTSFVDLHSPDD